MSSVIYTREEFLSGEVRKRYWKTLKRVKQRSSSADSTKQAGSRRFIAGLNTGFRPSAEARPGIKRFGCAFTPVDNL
jgi:hypothetical protein